MIKFIKTNPPSRSSRAQTMVEFALVFPIVLLLTYGIIEFGRMIFMYTALTSAAREGARYGVASGIGPNGIEQYADCAGIRAAVRKAAFLTAIPNDADIVIGYMDNHSSSLGISCATVASNPAIIKLGYQISVSVVNVKFTPLVGTFLGIKSFIIPTRVSTRTIITDLEFEP